MKIQKSKSVVVIGNESASTTFPAGIRLGIHSDGRIKAIIEKHRGYWRVWRIAYKNSGQSVLGGADSFRNFRNARNFVVANPAVWGE
jgi:hypothetical protein